MAKPIVNIEGHRFGRLVVVSRASNSTDGKARWLCQCDCGRQNIVMSKALRSKSNATRSCGCIVKEKVAKRNPLYSVWMGMRSRCFNKNSESYRLYGGRGIRVCERWNSFAAFLEDVGPRPHGHQIDRIDNDGDYEPGNVRWVTSAVNNRNTRQNHLITHNGMTMPLVDWAHRVGLKRFVIAGRLERGWSVAAALETPLLQNKWNRQPGHRSVT